MLLSVAAVLHVHRECTLDSLSLGVCRKPGDVSSRGSPMGSIGSYPADLLLCGIIMRHADRMGYSAMSERPGLIAELVLSKP